MFYFVSSISKTNPLSTYLSKAYLAADGDQKLAWLGDTCLPRSSANIWDHLGASLPRGSLIMNLQAFPIKFLWSDGPQGRYVPAPNGQLDSNLETSVHCHLLVIVQKNNLWSKQSNWALESVLFSFCRRHQVWCYFCSNIHICHTLNLLSIWQNFYGMSNSFPLLKE